jgi:D-alanyl-D-alanine carboxypeptidase
MAYAGRGAKTPDMLKLNATFCRKIMAAAGAVSALTVASFIASPAEARHWHSHRHYSHHASGRHHEASIRYHRSRASSPASHIAAIVVDGNSGRTLYARNENDLRIPASITKVMTLYLLFEQLEKGRLRLDSDIRVSSYAAAQKPTKLGLRPGQIIAVDDAIKAVVTRSANDIAVAIAETIGGDEESFARLMTQKAHSLGMNDTHFANASGLPNDDQHTTAHDLALLGRAVQERFPRYYHYFSTHVFYYRGAAIANHNHLLDRVEGMDGIKTGYTHASGFNLLTSVKRNGRYIVAVLLGGPSAGIRDRIMADLIEDQIGNAATIRTASSIAETSANLASAEAPVSQDASPRVRDQARREPGLAYAASAPKPDADFDPFQVASINPEIPAERPRPAYVSGSVKPDTSQTRAAAGDNRWKKANLDGSTIHSRPAQMSGASTATPSAMRAAPVPPETKSRGGDKIASAIQNSPYGGLVKIPYGRPAATRDSWMIQIGATPDVGKAAELLARAKSESPKMLMAAQAFTEKVQKGSETLYRARFSGLEADSAERACKTLKRSGFSCFATKN